MYSVKGFFFWVLNDGLAIGWGVGACCFRFQELAKGLCLIHREKDAIFSYDPPLFIYVFTWIPLFLLRFFFFYFFNTKLSVEL